MRHYLRTLLLLMACTLYMVEVSADKYSREWKEVEALLEQDLPESAAEIISHIWDLAAVDNDGRQMLKSAVALTQVQQAFVENSVTDGIELFNVLLPKLQVREHKALCHAFIAKGYIKYWQLNRYKNNQVLPSDAINPPLERWTAQMICDTICYHLNMSIELAGDVPAGYYKEFFPGGNKAGQKLRPELMDMLMDDAIVVLTDYRLTQGKRAILNDRRLYGSMQDFIMATMELKPEDPDLWMLYVLRCLSQNNLTSNPDIRCTIDMRRMSVLDDFLNSNSDYGWNRNYDAWLDGVLSLATQYGNKVKFSTMFYSMAARKIRSNIAHWPQDTAAIMQKKSHDICIAAQKKWPKSEGAVECQEIKAEMERSNVGIERKSDLLPGGHNIAKLKYKNIKSVYFKLVEVPSKLDQSMNTTTLLENLNGALPVVEWSMRVSDPGDYLEHSAFIDIPPVMQGSYYLLASTGSNFNSNDCIAYEYLECNGICMTDVAKQDGTLQGVALNVRTGQPVPNCKYTVWILNAQNEQTKIATSGITQADGLIMLEGMERGNYKIELEAADNRGNCKVYIPEHYVEKQSQSAQIYTDRYSYRPGDSIHIAGIVYNVDGLNGSVMDRIPLSILLMMNGKEIQYKTVTDSMGMFLCDYMLPQNIKPGRVAIYAVPQNKNDYTFQGYKTINIESFRQDKFGASIEEINKDVPYDSPVTIRGKATSYTGVPLDGAKVVWTANVYSNYCYKLIPTDRNGNVRVGSGEVMTASDGSFSFDVTVPSAIMLNSSCSVNIQATITDLNGETHSISSHYNVGKESYSLLINEMNSVNKGKTEKSLQFVLSGNNGILGGNLEVKITRLSWTSAPGLPLPFSVNSDQEKRELAQCVTNQSIKNNFPLYNFDFEDKELVETVVYEGTLNLEDAVAKIGSLSLKDYESGQYRVYVTGPGASSASKTVTVSRDDDSNFIPHNSILWSELIGRNRMGSDIKSAQVGDTLSIKIGNSWKGSLIHYVVETHNGVYKRGMIESNGARQLLSIPIIPELGSSFAVHCSVIYEGIVRNASYRCNVQDVSKKLDVEFVTFRNALEPNETEEWKFKVTDSDGNPVQATMLLDMYDSALNRYGTNSILLNPFTPVYASFRNLLQTQSLASNVYTPWLMSWKSFEYKGKRAITGTLTDPFWYRPHVKKERIKTKNLYDAPDLKLTGTRTLGITTVDEALQGRFAGLDIESVSLSEAQVSEVHDDFYHVMDLQDNTDESILIRSDFNPTALFEVISTDADGFAQVNFSAPELLTRWSVKGMAYTKSLATAYIDTTVVTSKKVMLEPVAPRFLREGDQMEFTAKVSSLMESDSHVEVALTLINPVNGRKLNMTNGSLRKTVTIPAGGNAATSFSIKVPQGITAVTYRMTAKAADHTDGVEETIPVLSNRTQVVQSLSLFNNGKEKRSFRMKEFDKPRSQTMSDESLTVEYSASPIWYAVQSLPALIRVDDPSNMRLFHSLMGAAISQNITERYPAIRNMLSEWAALPASDWETMLERNEALTGTLLDETPWYSSVQNEKERLRSLAKSLNPDDVASDMKELLEQIIQVQQSDGGWSWMKGMVSDLRITNEIVQGFGILIEERILEPTDKLNNTLKAAVDYLDKQFYQLYDVQDKPQSLGYSELNYLITRSYFANYPYSGDTRKSCSYYLELAKKQETHDLNLYYRAQLALLMSRTGNNNRAEQIVATIADRSLYSDEMGRWWRDNSGGLLWYEAPIETQSLIIRSLLAVGRKSEAVEAARWLLKQKQTTGWGSSPATAAAVVALMATGGDVQLEQEPDITITVGKESLKANGSKTNGGYTIQTWQGPISNTMGNITVESKTEGISWGAVYRSFTEDMDKVEHQENGISLERKVWRVVHDAQGDRLEKVTPNTVLNVGDRLKIQFYMNTDRNLEYVQLSDMRAATFEPVSTHAGYRYGGLSGIGYYAAPGNTRNVFYIDRMNKGSYQIEYEVSVLKPGTYTEGIATIQCLYAPAFRATTSSATITVEK